MLKVFDKNLTPTGLLPDAIDVQRKRRLNSDYELSFLVPMTSEDYTEKIQQKGHVQDENGQYYTINDRYRDRQSKKRMARIVCMHIMFKMADFKMPYESYMEEGFGVHISTLTNAISAATNGKFIFSILDDFGLRDIKDFGRGNALQALNFVVEKYGCEVEPDNFTIKLKKKIGADNGLQYRLKKNIISNSFKDSTRALVTRMYAQMKDGLTWIGQPTSVLTAEELSLLNAVPGAIQNGKIMVNYLISPYAASWANNTNTYYDGEFIDQNIEDPIELLEATRKALQEQEVPALEIAVNAADLHKIDGSEPKPNLGDTVYQIDPEMDLNNLTARIVELTEYPFAPDKHSEVTLANYLVRDYGDIIADLDRSKRIVDDILSGGRIRADVFEAFARQAVIDINNSKTELIYPPEGGILAQEKTNHLEQVRLTSKGLGISTDGWNTVRSAITALGVLAETVIGQFGNFVSMLIGSGNNVTQINTNGIAAGHADFNSAPYRVDMQGNVVANKLTANSAQINSSNFNNGAIVGSSINIGSGNFTVDTAGKVYAGDGTFRGIIQALGGSFSGNITASGTITGGIIKGARIDGGDINVQNDVNIGSRLLMNPGSFNSDIVFNSLAKIYGDPGGAIIADTDYFHTGSVIANSRDVLNELDGKVSSGAGQILKLQVYAGNLEVFQDGVMVGSIPLA